MKRGEHAIRGGGPRLGAASEVSQQRAPVLPERRRGPIGQVARHAPDEERRAAAEHALRDRRVVCHDNAGQARAGVRGAEQSEFLHQFLSIAHEGAADRLVESPLQSGGDGLRANLACATVIILQLSRPHSRGRDADARRTGRRGIAVSPDRTRRGDLPAVAPRGPSTAPSGAAHLEPALLAPVFLEVARGGALGVALVLAEVVREIGVASPVARRVLGAVGPARQTGRRLAALSPCAERNDQED